MESKRTRRNNQRFGTSLEIASVIGSGANKIKRKIRDIERLLNKKRDALPDTVILEKERTLEALKFELKTSELKQKAKKNARKYHMVRFFERKKALRRYKQALKQSKLASDDEKVQESLLQRKIDLCYVVNFPKTEKYIALYPPTTQDGSQTAKKGLQKTDIRRKAFREVVSKQLLEGSLPVSLDDILQGKKLNKEGTGVALDDEESEADDDLGTNVREGKEVEEDEDEFFE